MNTTFDYAIVGGGIVGISTAWQLKNQFPDKSVVLIEKETSPAQHQTGHNSGVIHSGIYYQPDSLKAKFCREGLSKTIQFCEQHGLPYEQCGKLLVATDDAEKKRMLQLYERSQQNQIETELIDKDELKRLEPEITGVGAIRVKATGIVDYTAICRKMCELFKAAGGEIAFGEEVRGLSETPEGIQITTGKRQFQIGFVVCCAGLMADRLAKMLEIPIDFSIIPYRGEYYRLPDTKSKLVKHLIYPIPDPDMPFLGIHLTRMIDGSITVGPNAVQGWKREGYGWINLSLKDTSDLVLFPGFWKVIFRNFQYAVSELKNSFWKRGYLKRIQRYCPSVMLGDLRPYPAGIRAQAVTKDGKMVHDFLFAESAHSLHVCNAPSPAATSAIPIGRYIVAKVAQKTSNSVVEPSKESS